MVPQINSQILASRLAQGLGLRLRGPDVSISCIAPLGSAGYGSLAFAKHFTSGPSGAVVIAPPLIGEPHVATIIESLSPRLDFVRALLWLEENCGFTCDENAPVIHSTASIGNFCTIGPGVVIGERTVIRNNVTIASGVRIGARCLIKSGTVIGEEGFGFERDKSGTPLRMLHLGGVRIGDDVEIGSLTTVCRGTLGDTIIESDVKIDDHVHVAHNVVVKRGALVAACAELSGGVEVGERVWIGPNSSVIQKVVIGDDAVVGIAANVLRSIDPKAVVVGNPGKSLSKTTQSG